MELVSVAAIADNLVIGRDGEIPWPSIPADREQYRDRVKDSPVILGRVTFESMLEDLPGSAQIVLSRSEREWDVETAYAARTVSEAIEIADRLDAETVYVLGGGGVYSLFQPHLDRMILTRVPGTYEGDSHYPEWDPSEWDLLERTAYDTFAVEEWERVGESHSER